MQKRIKGYEEQVHLLGSPKALMRSCILRDNKHCRILKKEITLYSYYLHVQALCEVLLRYILSLNPPCSLFPNILQMKKVEHRREQVQTQGPWIYT